jgi:uncharacterized integral membrane protein (TIGR00697 family)
MYLKLQNKEVRVYTILTALVICGLAGSLITAPKVVHFGMNFPFSNIIFSILTYPIVDCICELWGKQVARQTMWVGLASQFAIMLMIQLSIAAPHPDYWNLQNQYQSVLAVSGNVVFASLIAFSISQLMDIVIYQRIKEITRGKWLWLRSNISIYLGQIIDSTIFVMIVFGHSAQKYNILMGSITIKIILSFLMTPVIYLIVISVNRYLESNTLAFKDESKMELASV